jgi:hypothetical protein
LKLEVPSLRFQAS